MIKKIILTLMLCGFIVSCGKKGDPKYNDIEKKAELQSIITIYNS